MNLLFHIMLAIIFNIALYPSIIICFRLLGGYSQKVIRIAYIISSIIIFVLMILFQPLKSNF